MNLLRKFLLERLKKHSLRSLRDLTHPPNVRAGHLLLVMAANCLTGLPIEEDLLQAGCDLENALRQNESFNLPRRSGE